jgi:hypothetical protein
MPDPESLQAKQASQVEILEKYGSYAEYINITVFKAPAITYEGGLGPFVQVLCFNPSFFSNFGHGFCSIVRIAACYSI